MIDAASARILAEISARADDVLRAYTAGSQPAFADAAANARRVFGAANALCVTSADGYFVLERHGARAYTHDGSFTLRDGTLTTRSGEPVLGYTDAQARERGILTPLRADAIDGVLGRARDPQIDADGAVSYMRSVRDTHSGLMRSERVRIGLIALARFPAATQPVRIDATHVGAPHGVAVHYGSPADGNFHPLATFSRDGGGDDVDAALLHLQEAYRSFDALQSAREVRLGIDKTTMDLLK